MTDYSYQLYSSRNHGPLPETLKMLSRLGYKQVEGYGALYADAAKVAELMDHLAGSGLSMPTGHFSLDMVRDRPDEVVKIAEAFDIDAVIVPAVANERRKTDAAGWRALGKELAAAGEPIWKAGRKFGWHNHAFEFVVTSTGEVPLDLILEADPRLVLELDVAWLVRGNQDPLIWIEKYKDRLIAAHVKDIAPFGEKIDEDGWADLGDGTLDWAAYMAALKGTKAKYFVMEHDNPKDPERFARRSIAAAQQL